MLYGFLIAVQMILSVLLVVSILLQASKGGGLSGIAGGMMSSTVFGGRGAASFLVKATTILTTLFMLNCLGMAVLSTMGNSAASVTQQAVQQSEPSASPVPAIPGGQTVSGEAAPQSQSQPPAETPAQTP